MPESLEERVVKLEAWARKPNWLDEPAIIDGQPVIMGATFPWPVKIYGGILAVIGLGLFGVLLWIRFVGPLG